MLAPRPPGGPEREGPPAASTILLVDDEPLLREFIRCLLDEEPGVRIVGEAGNGREAVASAGETRPDVILLDLEMPVMDGLTALPQLARASPGSRIVVFTGHDPVDVEARVRSLGAFAFVRKGSPIQRILDEIRRAAEPSSGASLPARER